MIRITPTETSGFVTNELGYIEGRKGIARFILPLTRYLRAVNAEKYITPAKRLLDIGCGDGYFIRRSKCTERYGLDKRTGDEVTGSLDFPDEWFDYVTMLAVIEHIPEPGPLMREIGRVLKPGGKLVITTPRRQAEFLIRLYIRDIDEEHETYHTAGTIAKLAGDEFCMYGHHNFLLGLNQTFCLKKIAPHNT